ncbi:WecB/TagA/CpsF family glycosyltransferase [Vampirovibrio chlorellavorus]|uniref:WecB/TagA/CpsF family glycosyltransferase n=1 Tax=Vampirovibrio chlorellavorus TaxID=758823 RepID=UPI0026F094D7|nr:WecB/TagA/CpsF family glycosyltransferase [Vampirovibrio chlorellavorus]
MLYSPDLSIPQTREALGDDSQPGQLLPDPRSDIEGIGVDNISCLPALFERLRQEARRPGKSVFAALNIHIANIAHQNPTLRQFLQASDVVYCDGAGIVLASRLLGNPLPCRFTAADWLLDLWAYLSQHGITAFYLGGEPGIAEKALAQFEERMPQHTILGVHHGFILQDEALERQVIDRINALQPDVLFVGFGCPLQEMWIQRHQAALNVSVFYPIGATLDYLTRKVPRCPAWMGENGLEWLFRFLVEPRRMFGRYIVGNPWFLWRIGWQALQQRLG